jgi:cellulose biosynthesis protein BcsQ
VIDCAPGLSQLVWGALRAADIVFIPYVPDRTAEDNVGWLIQRLKAMEHQKFLTIANRVLGHDSRAQGIVSAINGRYSPLGVQVPAAQALATALDYRDQPGTLASKFGSAAQYVNALADAALDAINRPMPVAAE